MIRVYGMEIGPDCLEAKEQRLLLAGIDFEFLDFADSTENLKEFLKLRKQTRFSMRCGGRGISAFHVLCCHLARRRFRFRIFCRHSSGEKGGV